MSASAIAWSKQVAAITRPRTTAERLKRLQEDIVKGTQLAIDISPNDVRGRLSFLSGYLQSHFPEVAKSLTALRDAPVSNANAADRQVPQ